MTIKKRLFLSNLFMLLIPALVSVLILALSMLLFVNLFYKQAMDETVRGENTVYLEHLLVKQAEEFLQTDHKALTDSHLYQTVEKYVQTQSIQLQIYDGDALVCSMGDRHEDLAEMPLYMLSNGNVYVEPITIDDHNYTIYIAFFAPVQESTWNEMIVKYLIAGISHDLRTPLTSIKAYIEGLIEGVAQTPERQQKYMQTIREKANDIDRMVDKLFLFSKLDLGDNPFYPEPIPVAEALHSLVAANAEEYARQGMTVVLDDIPTDCVVCADPVQFRNAILNLLENSLKYKDDPEVQVRIGCTETSSDATISVTDNGPGVPEEALSKLFDVFYRSDPSRSNPQKGSGLGLAITAKILERFGGSVQAENVHPKGLRILLTIPKEEAKP